MERQSDNSFNKYFREKLSDFEQQPSELSWIAVSAHLDAVRAQKRKRNFWIAGILAFVILAGGGIFTWQQLNSNSTPQLAFLQDFPEFEFHFSSNYTANSGNNQDLRNQHFVDNSGNVTLPPDQKAGSNIIPSNERNTSGHNKSNSSGKSEEPFSPFNKKLAKAQYNWNRNSDPEFTHNPFLLKDGALNNEAFKMGRIGLVTGFQSGTLTGDVISNYMSDDNATRSFKLRPVFGISAAYDFNQNFGIETNVLISSAEGQKFTVGEKELDLSLNYIRIPVMAKFRTIKMVGQQRSPIALNAKAGVQYGRMNWVNIDDFDGQFSPVDLNSNELGLVTELAIDKYMSDDYIITLGARGSMNGNVKDLNKFFSPDAMTNYSVGIFLQLNYGIK